jgi:N-acetyl sugar amidotransferase
MMPEATMCQRCVMRVEDDPALQVRDGVCNHCRRYDDLLPTRVVEGEAGLRQLDAIVADAKKRRRGRDYDCLIGVSGGVDSTYVAMTAKKLGLRPLALHLDNGWNSETAVRNIERTLDTLGIDLHTEVLDLREFYDLQRSFLVASTPDGEIPTDHAIQATVWQVANRRGIKYILSGMNFRTEAIDVPSWSYGHSDWRYIRSVQRAHGTRRLTQYPHYGLGRLASNVARGTRIVSILNYLDYDKTAAEAELASALGWESYGSKHFESIYTRFYQGYVLPTKFGIDKRRGHFSDLINSGLMPRAQALAELETSGYPDEQRRQDQDLVLKKLKLSPEEFAGIMAAPIRSFRDYSNNYARVQWLRRSVNTLRRRGWYPR